jgi:DNA-binding NtrC family response regulator
VVDDEPIMAALLATALESGGYEVRTAPDAPKARADLDRFDPDMVVLDIALGRGPSGVDLAHVVHRRHPGVGILLLTKHPDLRTAGISP